MRTSRSPQSSASKIGVLGVVEEEMLVLVSVVQAAAHIPFSEALPVAFPEADD